MATSPVLPEIDGNLAARVANPHDERPLALPRRAVPVRRAVDDLPAKGALPRPRGLFGNAVVPGGHDEPARVDLALSGADDPLRAVVPRARDLAAEPRLDLELRGVALEVRDHLGARGIHGNGAGPREAGERRELLDGVEMKPLVVSTPGGSDRARPLDDDERDAFFA